jgi:hypothetical protein
MTLIARWSRNQDMSIEDPQTVLWLDGTLATIDVYRQHILDTHTGLLAHPDRFEQHIFPNIVAVVSYDKEQGRWVVSGRGVIPATLDLTDPEAADDDIQAELYTYPIVYKAKITR